MASKKRGPFFNDAIAQRLIRCNADIEKLSLTEAALIASLAGTQGVENIDAPRTPFDPSFHRGRTIRNIFGLMQVTGSLAMIPSDEIMIKIYVKQEKSEYIDKPVIV